MKTAQTALAALSLTAAVVSLPGAARASDFDLKTLPSFAQEISLSDHVGQTYYDLMTSELKDKMAGARQAGNDDDLLKSGAAIALRLNDTNINMHVNFYDAPTSGRSYGWTRGQVGDWSDRAYLTHMIEVAKGSDQELSVFYSTLVKMLGNCDASTLSQLSDMSERVATNFLAIYGAEEYRATLGTKNWDDALFETTLLAAFHAGQKTVTKYYMGEFSDRSYKQLSGIFNAHGQPALQPDPSTEKAADLTDYWQLSPIPSRKNSGINETRPDFEKMGQVITQYEKNNADLQAIEQTVGGDGTNVIKDLTTYFAYGKAQAAGTDELASHVASLMIRIRADAQRITEQL